LKRSGKHKKKVDSYLKYTGLAFQMAAVIAIAIFAGQWLDERYPMDIPVFTLVLTLLLFGGYMYKLTRELMK